jgi:hypothetical protein
MDKLLTLTLPTYITCALYSSPLFGKRERVVVIIGGHGNEQVRVIG